MDFGTKDGFLEISTQLIDGIMVFTTKLDWTGSFVYALQGQHVFVYYNATKGKGKTKKPHKFPFTLNLRKCHWVFFDGYRHLFQIVGFEFILYSSLPLP